jgi:hypothetical protein
VRVAETDQHVVPPRRYVELDAARREPLAQGAEL